MLRLTEELCKIPDRFIFKHMLARIDFGASNVNIRFYFDPRNGIFNRTPSDIVLRIIRQATKKDLELARSSVAERVMFLQGL